MKMSARTITRYHWFDRKKCVEIVEGVEVLQVCKEVAR